MPATTSKMKIPYPLPTDKLGQYPDTAKQAADKIDDTLGPLATPSSVNLTASAGWTLYPTASQVKSLGALHLINLTILRAAEYADVQPKTEYQIATLPAGIPEPPDWTPLGIMQFAGGTLAVSYRAQGRKIILYPLSTFRINTNDYGYAQCAWIA